MLLSYWDTYWNDNIIAEQYDKETELDNAQISIDVESPGILQEPASIADEDLTAEEYYQKITGNSNSYLHLKLMQIGGDELQLYDFDSDDAPVGMDYADYKPLMEYYLYDYRGLSRQTIGFQTFHSVNSEDVRQYAIDLLKQGIPVKLGVQGPTGNHAVIAYDYDEVNDEIYVHSGLVDEDGNTSSHVTIRQIGYNIYKNAMAMVLYDGGLHNCSNNFYFIDDDNYVHTYCPCSLEIHGKKQTIVYHNLTFGTQTAIVIKDNSIRKRAPTTYQHGVGLDLSNITAYISAESAYSPHMVFLGWLDGEDSNIFIENISQTQAGTVHLYAYWRYDYTTIGRIGTHIINGSQFYTQEYDQIYIGPLVNQINDLQALGMGYLAIKVKINMWEETENTNQSQYVYICNGYSSTYNQLAVKQITTATNVAGVQEMWFYISLDKLVGLNYIYVCYASSSNQSSWATDRMYGEMMCVVEKWDATSDPDFYFSYDDPFV